MLSVYEVVECCPSYRPARGNRTWHQMVSRRVVTVISSLIRGIVVCGASLQLQWLLIAMMNLQRQGDLDLLLRCMEDEFEANMAADAADTSGSNMTAN